MAGESGGTLKYFENTGTGAAPIFVAAAGTASPFDGVGTASAPGFADLDGDGDLDEVVGLGDGTLRYFENTGTSTAPAYLERVGAANPFNGVDVGEQARPSFADVDGDGDLGRGRGRCRRHAQVLREHRHERGAGPTSSARAQPIRSTAWMSARRARRASRT